MAITGVRIARELKISPTAVSLCLNDMPGVSEKLRQQVKSLAEKLGYTTKDRRNRTNGIKSGVKKIAVLYPVGSSEIFQSIQNGVESVLKRTPLYTIRYTVDAQHLQNNDTKDIFFSDLIENEQISGLIVVFFKISDNLILKLRKKGVPVVCLGNPSEAGSCVVFDNYTAAYNATKALIRSGKKQIGCIMALNVNNDSFEERFKGYRQALKDYGVKYKHELVGYEYSFQLKNAAYVTGKLMRENPGIDAIIFGNDTQAMAGMRALREMNLKIPDDVAVVGFDDIDSCQLMVPPLSSVRLPWQESGEKSAQLLLGAINARKCKLQKIQFKPELVIRGSFSPEINDPKWIE